MISIGFSTTNKILSRFVRWFSKSKASHSFILFDWLGKKWVIEAEWAGVQIIPYERFLARDNIIVSVVEIPEATMDHLELALADSGVQYDYSGLLGAAFPVMGKWLKMKWKNPWNNTKAMFCSEFIVLWLQKVKLEGAKDLIAEDVSPDDLLKFITKG